MSKETLSRSLKRRSHGGDLYVDERVILKLVLKICVKVGNWVELAEVVLCVEAFHCVLFPKIQQ
jgi:hypothetical protein